MEYLVHFMVNIFDLGVFLYYLNSLKKMKRIHGFFVGCSIFAMAAIWAVANGMENPQLNLVTLVGVLMITTLFFETDMKSRIINIVIFVAVGIIIEPIGLVLLRIMKYASEATEVHKYYFVVVLCGFIRGNILYLLSKMLSKKKVRLSKLPKGITSVLVTILAFAVINCCFVIVLSLETMSSKSLIMCISIIVSIVLTYYFMLYMMERFNYLERKRYEDELYRKEMYYKEIYYSEVESRNEYVHNLKHDMKNKLIEFHHLLDKRDMLGLEEQLNAYCKEFDKIDENSYSDNPVVDSVLRIKLGVAKSEGIRTDTSIRIPKKMQLEYGDIGVLYGNLLDNAIEACRKVPKDNRFIQIENIFLSGKMILVVKNSKTGKKNESLKTTKENSYLHGRGIQSVQRVVDKYNGTIGFVDEDEIFEVSVMLYGLELIQ